MIKAPEASSYEELLDKFGTIATNTVGKSMFPLFKTHRDAVVIKKKDGPLKKYDVVCYKIGSRYVLHRIIDIRGGICIIRGDNTYKKEYVLENKILGVLVSFNRRGKHHEVTELGYKIYSRVWHCLYFPRYLFVLAFRGVRKIFRIFFPKKRK